MASVTWADQKNNILDRLQANVANDPPFLPAELLRHGNEAYNDLWEMSGGSILSAAGGTLWSPGPTSTTSGKLTGILASVAEFVNVWATTSAASVGGIVSDILLDRVERSRIQQLRATTVVGPYATPRLYSITRLNTATAADVDKHLLDVWPGVAGYYFPADYRPEFTALTGDTDVMDLPETLKRDASLLIAMRLAPLCDRAFLVPSISLDLSQRTQDWLAKRAETLASATQDRS